MGVRKEGSRAGQVLRARGFQYDVDQPAGATDYVVSARVFHVRVRIPVRSNVQPALWVGFTAGGPLVERQSATRYRDVARLVEDALFITRILFWH